MAEAQLLAKRAQKMDINPILTRIRNKFSPTDKNCSKY